MLDVGAVVWGGLSVEVGGVKVGKSTLTAVGSAVCLYRASNCISSGNECDLIFLSSRALIGYTISIFSPSLLNATGGSAVLVDAVGPSTTCNISFGTTFSLSLSVVVVVGGVVEEVVVVEITTGMSGSSGVSNSRFSPGGPSSRSDSIFISKVGVGTGAELVTLVSSVGMNRAVVLGSSRDPNIGNRGAYAETNGRSVSLA